MSSKIIVQPILIKVVYFYPSMKSPKMFVFVVCGDEEHIDTLNFSLKALRQFSNIPIVVVTDLQRNDKHIEHDERHVLDIHTPSEFDNHQASIFLKTGLHRFLPMENADYCYLDSDVVALNYQVNRVFDQFVEPITFCSDHCRMNEFSSSAVKCGCNEKPNELQRLLNKYDKFSPNRTVIDSLLKEWDNYLTQNPFPRLREKWYDSFVINDSILRRKRDRLIELTNPKLSWGKLMFNYLFKILPNYKRSLKTKKWSDWSDNVLIDEGSDYFDFMKSNGFCFVKPLNQWIDPHGSPVSTECMSFDRFIGDRGFVYDNNRRSWYTNKGDLFLPDIVCEVEIEGDFRFDENNDTWFDREGNPVFSKSCNHLKEAIEKDFGVEVKNHEWQHWNGGVFLFNQHSVQFLDTWHELTLEAFSLRNWKTRDQGTLIATVWKFGLENQPKLPVEYNFIADFNHPTMLYKGDLTFCAHSNAEKIKPHFIHIYHHWGDVEWDLWNDIIKIINE